MTDFKRINIAILMDHPSPHMVDFLDAIARSDEIAAQVVYFRCGAPERSWGDPPGSLPFEVAAASKHSTGILNVHAVLRAISHVRADIWVVNSCYTAPETWAAIEKFNRTDTPWVYMNEPARMGGHSDGIKRGLLRLMLKRAAGVIGMSQGARAQFSALTSGRIPSASIPYFLDLSEFLALAPAKAPAVSEPVHFFTAAQLIHRKGIDILLAACRQLPTAGWKLTLAGDGPLRSKLECAFAAELDPETIRFLGQIPYDQRSRVFVGQHVFVFPSRWDGWGMAPVEAMAAGLPVISSDQVMSMREMIFEGKNGYLFSCDNATDLAERMSRFITNPARISDMGKAARAALIDYRPEIGVATLKGFLAELVQHGNSKHAPSSAKRSTGQNSLQTWRELTEPVTLGQRLRMHTRALAKQKAIDLSLAVKKRSVPRGNRILVYHLVLQEDRARFEEHLLFLKDHYQVVTTHELAQARSDTNLQPLAAISFDDGFRVLMSDALELLEKHQVKATFYIPTGFVELASDPARAADFSLRAHYYQHPLEPMTIEDLRELRRLGHEIGSHGVSHVSMRAVSRSIAIRELVDSRNSLNAWTGEPVAGFAYPYGHTVSSLGRVPEWVATAGYEYAVTLQRGPVTFQSSSMQLQREHIEGNWRAKDLAYFLSR